MATIRELRAKFTADPRGMTNAFRDVRREASQLGPDVQRSTRTAGAAFTSLIGNTSRLQAAIADSDDPRAFDDLQRAIQEAQREMAEVGSVSETAMRELQTAVRAGAGHLDTLDDASRSALDGLETAIRDVNGDLRDIGNRNGLGDLSGDIDDVSGNLDDLSDNLDDLSGDVDDAGDNLDDLHDNLDDVGDSADRASGDVENFGDTATRESGNAERGFGKVGKALGGLAGLVAGAFAIDALKDFGTDLAATAGGAQAANAQFSTVFGDMEGEATETLQAIGSEATILENRMKGTFTQIAAFAKTGGMDTAESLDLADRSMRAIADSAAFYDRSLEDTAESLQSFLKGNFENDAALGLSSTETTRNIAANELYGKSFAKLSEQQKQLVSLQMVEDANKVSGAMGQASRESEGWENVMGNLQQSWTDFKAEIGTPVLEVAVAGIVAATKAMGALDTEAIAKGIGVAFDWTKDKVNLAKGAIQGIVDFLKGNESAEDMLSSFGLNPDDFQKVITAMNTMKEALSKVWDSFKTGKAYVEAVFALFKNQDGTAIQLLHKLGLNPEQIQKIMDGVDAVKSVFTDFLTGIRSEIDTRSAGIMAGFKSITDGIKAVFSYLMPIIKPALSAVLTFASGIISKIAEFWTSEGKFIVDAIQNIGKIVGVVFGAIFKVVQFVMPAVLAIIKSLWGNVKGVITGGLDVIMGAVKVFSGLFTGDFGKMWEGIKQMFFGAINFIWNFVQLTFFGKILGGAKAFVLTFRTFFVSLWQGIVSLFKGNLQAAQIIISTAWQTILRSTTGTFRTIWTFLKDIFKSIRSISDNLMAGIRVVFSTGWGFITRITSTVFRGIWTVIKTAFNLIVSGIRGAITLVRTVFTAGWGFITRSTSSAFNGIWSVIKGIMGFIRTVIVTAFNFYRNIFTGGWGFISQVTRTVFTTIWNFLRATMNTIRGVFTGAVNLFKSIFSAAWGIISRTTIAVFRGIWNGIKTVMNLILSGIRGSINLIKTVFSAGWSIIQRTTSAVFNGIWSFLRGTFNLIKNMISGAINYVKNVMINGWSVIGNSTSRTFNTIWTFLRGIFTKVRDFIGGAVSSVLNKVRDTWSALKNTTTRTFTDIFNAVKSKFNNIVDLAKALPGRIGDGIGAMAGKVSAGVTKVINKLASVLGKGVNGVIGGINWVLDKVGSDSKIPKWDVPQYAQGTRGHHPGGPMVVGDGKGSNRGPELIETPDGKQMLSPSKPTLMNGAKGTKVWSARETKKILAMVPHYALGDKIKGGLRSAGDWAAEKYNSGKEKVKGVAKKVKDVAVNAFDYIKKPGAFLDLALKTLGIDKPKGGTFPGDMALGGFNKAKSAAVNYVKKKMEGFGLTQSGVTVMGGNGGGFGAPYRLTSRPGPRNTGIPGASTFHKGWDWAAPTGTPIPSVSDGVVSRNSWHPLSGNFIEVKSGNRVHRYQHNSKNIAQVGQKVSKGQTIALVGATGVGSGSHLHYELKGYEDGGIVNGNGGAQLAWLTEGGWSESVISHDPAKKTSQKAIWEKTGRELGFDTSNAAVLEVLERIADGVHSGRDLQVIMDSRVVGQMVESHVDEQRKLRETRVGKFKGDIR